MEILRALLIVVEAILSLLLVAVILLQRAKNEGLGLAFGAQVGETLFGSRAGNVLSRITVWLGAIFIANTVLLAVLYAKGSQGSLMQKAVGAGAATAPMKASRPSKAPAPGRIAPATPLPESQNVPVTLPAAAPSTPAPAPAPAAVAPAPAPAPAAK